MVDYLRQYISADIHLSGPVKIWSGYSTETNGKRWDKGLRLSIFEGSGIEVPPRELRIDDFLKTVDFSEYKIAIDQRKKLAKRLSDLRATQRATGKMLGVAQKTISGDLQSEQNYSKSKTKPAPIKGKGDISEQNYSNPFAPPEIMQSGSQAAKAAEKAAKIVAVGMAEEAKRLAQDDAHDAGTIVIYAEAKLGKLLAANPPGFNRKNSGEIQQNLLPMSRILDIETGDTHNTGAIKSSPGPKKD